MEDKLSFLGALEPPGYYNGLFNFYSKYFEDDQSCISFLYNALEHDPKIDWDLAYKDGIDDIDKALLAPRRMLNAVKRFVSVAKDMELIRPGKDAFKVIFILTCIETLQTLKKGETIRKKRVAIVDFFKNHTSPSDRNFLIDHFEYIPDDFWKIYNGSIEDLPDALYNIRNAAVHTGEFWDTYFMRDEYHMVSTIPESQSDSGRGCIISFTYEQFEHIFVRTCINFISDYISSQYCT